MFLVIYYECYVGYSLTDKEKIFFNEDNAKAYAEKLNKEILAAHSDPSLKIEDLGDKYEVVEFEKGD